MANSLVKLVAAVADMLFGFVTSSLGIAEARSRALVRAYQTNAQPNAQRAPLGIIDESVSPALAGCRPQA